MDKKELRYFLPFVAGVFLFVFSIPAADLPLNDDIIYFESVKNFVENGSLVNNQPYIASVFLQIFYGSAFALVFGMTHASLMLSMMFMGVLVVVSTYFLLRLRLDAKFSVLGSLLLLVNPVFFNLTHTFMTDVFALLFMVTSAFFFIKFSDKKKYSYLVIGVLLAVAGFWVRQYALMTIAGMFVYLFLRERKLFFAPKTLLILVAPALISTLIWGYWFFFVHDQSYVCPYTLGFAGFVKNIPQLFIYAGYFLFPLGIAFALGYRKIFSWLKSLGILKIIPVLVLVAMIAFILVRGYVGVDFNPFDKSLAEPRGVGAYTISGDKVPFFSEFLWVPIIALSFASAFSVVVLFLKRLKENLPIVLMIAFLALPMLFFTAFYDRYFLFLIPLSLPLVLADLRGFRYSKHVLVAGIIVLGLWSWYVRLSRVELRQVGWHRLSFVERRRSGKN
jgi:4-amino-4-deoxy-L-arabinose transferase-like glycosyltransferase